MRDNVIELLLEENVLLNTASSNNDTVGGEGASLSPTKLHKRTSPTSSSASQLQKREQKQPQQLSFNSSDALKKFGARITYV